MQHLTLLYVALGGDSRELRESLIAGGWEVAQAADLAAASRLQAHRSFPAALLVIGDSVPVPEAEIEA